MEIHWLWQVSENRIRHYDVEVCVWERQSSERLNAGQAAGNTERPALREDVRVDIDAVQVGAVHVLGQEPQKSSPAATKVEHICRSGDAFA